MYPERAVEMATRNLIRIAAIACLVGMASGTAAASPEYSGSPPGEHGPDTSGPIGRPLVAEIGLSAYVINEFGADSIYLIVGTRRALVIDTGSGFFDLPAAISRITDKPYAVVITHGHPDHAGGAGFFPSVYIDPQDMAMARAITYEQRVEYGQIMRSMTAERVGFPIGFKDVWAYSDSSVRRLNEQPEMRALHDGQVFDLGGRKVTAYHIGIHTSGSTVFLDDRSRILFTGDVANPNVRANVPVSSALRGLLRLRAMRRKYDRTFTGHTAYANLIEPMSQDPVVLDDLIEAFRDVLHGTAEIRTVKSHLFPDQELTVAVHGRATVGFDPKLLWEPGEQHSVP